MKTRFLMTAAAVLSSAASLTGLADASAGAQPATASGVVVGEAAPDFTLTDTHGTAHSLSDFAGQTVVLEWTNKDCPFVGKFYGSGKMQEWQGALTEPADDAEPVVWLTLCSSAPGKQGHMEPEAWNAHIDDTGIASTAVLLDADGAVGHRYAAKTTPHIYVIDGDGVLRYQGAIDSVRSTDAADIDGATNYLMAAVTAIAAGTEIAQTDTKPYGCGMKY